MTPLDLLGGARLYYDQWIPLLPVLLVRKQEATKVCLHSIDGTIWGNIESFPSKEELNFFKGKGVVISVDAPSVILSWLKEGK